MLVTTAVMALTVVATGFVSTSPGALVTSTLTALPTAAFVSTLLAVEIEETFTSILAAAAAVVVAKASVPALIMVIEGFVVATAVIVSVSTLVADAGFAHSWHQKGL